MGNDEWRDLDESEITSEQDSIKIERVPGQAGWNSVPAPLSFPQFDSPPPSTDRRSGCFLSGLGVGVIVLSLVLLALLLPPISLWEEIDQIINDDSEEASDPLVSAGLEFARFSAEMPRVQYQGLVIETAPDDMGQDYGVHVVALAPADYLAAKTPAQGWYCDFDLPARHALASPVYSLMQNGQPPAKLTLRIMALPEANTDPAALALYSWNATSGAWEFVPAAPADPSGMVSAQMAYLPRCVALFRASESTRTVGLTLGLTDTFAPAMLTGNARVYPGGLRPNAAGALQGVLASGFEIGQSYAVMPLIQNFDDPAVIDVATVQAILGSEALRTEHTRQIAAFVLRDNYAGVVIDYRQVPPAQRDSLSVLIRDLAGLLHGQGRLLTVVVPPPAYDGMAKTWQTGAYDWRALGLAADELVITMPLDPRIYLSGGMADTLIQWAVTQVSRNRLVLGINALGVEDQGNGITAPVTLDQALASVGSVQLDPPSGQTITARLTGPGGVQTQFGFDDTIKTPYVRYLGTDGATLRTMWITSPAALLFRMDFAATYNLGGVMVRHVMASGTAPGLENALLAFRLAQADSEVMGFDLALKWIVRAGDSVLHEEDGTPDQPFSYDMPADQQNLTVEAQLNGAPLGSSQPVVAAVPTVQPTAESVAPTPTPSEPVTTTSQDGSIEVTGPVVSDLPQPGGEASASGPVVSDLPQPGAGEPSSEEPAAPPSASGEATVFILPEITIPTVDPAALAGATIGTAFEAGARISQFKGPVVLPMGRAHLLWVRVDIEFRLGMVPDEQKITVDNAQANGFKILFSVMGSPDELASADRADYLNQYAAYVGGLAALGADGIEVWREMNAAGWPAGQIDPAAYNQMLGLSYHAIKTANPNTLVIGGTLAPTAEDTEQPETAWNDDTYAAGLAAAGAAQYMDCVGAVYTQGAVAPDATTGDPRGDKPIFYLPTMTDRVWNAFGGALPVCYTALGYPVDQAITVDTQTQWLAAAIQAGLASDKIRLMILWNMDATESPAAGYALIQPDGSCPACDAITPVLE